MTEIIDPAAVESRVPFQREPLENTLQYSRQRSGWQRWGRFAARTAIATAVFTAPAAGALNAIKYGHAEHLDIAGQDVGVKPVIGQNTSSADAFIRPEHEHWGGKDIGVDLQIDWNNLLRDTDNLSYLGRLSEDPKPEVARIKSAAHDYMLEWGLGGLGTMLLAESGIWFWRRNRQKELAKYPPEAAEWARKYNRRPHLAATAGALALVAGLDASAAMIYLHNNRRTVVGSPLFNGTRLEGTEASGAVGDILPFASLLIPKSDFDDQTSRNLETALAANHDFQKVPGDTLFVVAEDFEDVNGMARQVGLASKLIHADFIAYTGDLTFGGNPAESYLIDTVNYYSDGTHVYFAPGPHDTSYIVDTAKSRGWTIADGKTHTVDGMRMLLVADPRISTVGEFGSGDVPRTPDASVAATIRTTIAEACRTHPLFTLLHDEKLGGQIAEAGCQDGAFIDGRSFHLVGPKYISTQSGETVEFTSGSAGGHVDTTPDPGPIQHPATFEAFKYNKFSHKLSYYVFTANPDTSFSVTPAIDIAVPYSEFLKTGRTEPDTPTLFGMGNADTAQKETATSLRLHRPALGLGHK